MFISYRRADAVALAEQLFEEFSEAGFDVFLDRFRGTPGRSFPTLLNEFLMDKGLVLVIESPQVDQSQWTLAEVRFAMMYQLGLLTITMPGGKRFSSIRPRDRYAPSTHWDPVSPCTAKTVLTDTGIKELIAFVRRRYAVQIVKRRAYLDTLLVTALARHGIASTLLNGLRLIANGPGYVIESSARPPGLEQIRRARQAASLRQSCAVVVGPASYLPPYKQTDLKWLVGAVGVHHAEETAVTRLARQISSGSTLP